MSNQGCGGVSVLGETPKEKSTFWLESVMKDRKGAPIPASSVSSIRLWLYVRDTAAQETINGVTNVEILNTSRCLLEETSGLFEIKLDPPTW